MRIPLGVPESPAPTDVRTTPAAARVPVLLALLLLGLYLLGGVASAEAGFADPDGSARMERVFWLGRWRMFTDLRTRHSGIDAELRRDGAWAPVDLAAVYPSRWDEGPGWLRDDFVDDAPRVRRLVLDLCRRTGADAARLTRVRWQKTLGQREPPRGEGEERRVLWDGPCAG